ncbi:biotin carboxylase N-terminal domain-containing protein [Bacteroides sp. CR5/BHMF/2]|nr:biotin carboxylase N-terminal domain-containing protein [Bacteroides sp. CR5/BHMF/2]
MYLIEKYDKKILVANRGENCRKGDALLPGDGDNEYRYLFRSRPDREARAYADEAYCVGPAASKESYLNIEKSSKWRKQLMRTPSIRSYGFLSENATFARRCQEEGIIFIGPNPETMEAMGDKIAARIENDRGRSTRCSRHTRQFEKMWKKP